MGLFDRIKTSDREINLTKDECYLFLPYYFYASDGFKGLEVTVFMQAQRMFFGDGEIDIDFFFEKFETIGKQHKAKELLDFCISNIDKEDLKKLFICLTEGVLADGRLDEDEKLKINYATQLMNIDNNFADKVIEVAMAKYFNQ